jgi:hypothetical protein
LNFKANELTNIFHRNMGSRIFTVTVTQLSVLSQRRQLSQTLAKNYNHMNMDKPYQIIFYVDYYTRIILPYTIVGFVPATSYFYTN